MDPLIVIIGPTASGKTALSIELAKKFNGEIICADSRTVYKGMNIGTAKPTVPEMQGIKHYLLDLIEPNKPFTVSDFQKLAYKAIEDIQSRGKLPIMVGGSGLYVNSVIFGYDFSQSSGLRDPQNPRHLAPEVPRQDLKLRENTLIIGIDVEMEILEQRIIKRINEMVDKGLVNEVSDLSKKYGWEVAPMQAPAYKAFKSYVEKSITLEEAKRNFALYDRQLAKKQRTWFKRNNSIQWLSDPSEAYKLVDDFLNNH